MPTVVDGDFEWDSTKAESIGTSLRERLLYVVHVERGDRDRIISARLASPAERDVYEGRGQS